MTDFKVKSYDEPKVNIREILRYAKSGSDDKETEALVRECLTEALPRLSYKTVHLVLDVTVVADTCNIGGIIIHSTSLAKNLSGVKKAILTTATVGLGIDRLTAKYSRTSPTKALIMQAIGTERVEAVLDELTKELEAEYERLRPRFSVGYGDAPLTVQKEITERLDTGKTVGVFLSESFIMTPTKSVTAIIGIET